MVDIQTKLHKMLRDAEQRHEVPIEIRLTPEAHDYLRSVAAYVVNGEEPSRITQYMGVPVQIEIAEDVEAGSFALLTRHDPRLPPRRYEDRV